MKVLHEKNNSLLKRKEVLVESDYEANPGFEKAGNDLAQHFKTENDVVVVRKVGSSYGSEQFVIEAMIYNSVKDKNDIEPKKKEKKK